MENDKCYVCDKLITTLDKTLNCFICKCETHISCSDVEESSRSLIGQWNGTLFYACRLCRQTIRETASDVRTSTADDQLILLQSEIEKRIEVTLADTALCFNSIDEHKNIELQSKRELETCNQDRTKLATILKHKKNHTSNAEFEKISMLYKA